jgi:allantoate deiminase
VKRISEAERRVAGRVDEQRLWSNLAELANMGADAAAGPGIWRASWTPAYRAAQRWVKDLMADAGLDVWIDAIGNTWGRWPVGSLPALVIGSHIDAVPGGGKFDGTLGVIGAIEAVKALRHSGFVPKREIRVVAWVEEEGSATGIALLGSRGFAGGLTDRELNVLKHQVMTSSEAGTSDDVSETLAEGRMEPGAVCGYLELHVEQGPLLWESGIPIGIVTNIVALEAGHFDFRGVMNHAGGTPMDRRKDALVAASEVILAVRDAAIASEVRATCGAVDVSPAASNVIPGHARVSLDLRSVEPSTRNAFWRDLESSLDAVRSRTGVSIDFSSTYSLPAVAADKAFQDHIREAADGLQLRTINIPSGAVHDAIALASARIPIGMVFVPSEEGVSHAPNELTKTADCGNGAAVLALVIQRLASEG